MYTVCARSLLSSHTDLSNEESVSHIHILIHIYTHKQDAFHPTRRGLLCEKYWIMPTKSFHARSISYLASGSELESAPPLACTRSPWRTIHMFFNKSMFRPLNHYLLNREATRLLARKTAFARKQRERRSDSILCATIYTLGIHLFHTTPYGINYWLDDPLQTVDPDLFSPVLGPNTPSLALSSFLSYTPAMTKEILDRWCRLNFFYKRRKRAVPYHSRFLCPAYDHPERTKTITPPISQQQHKRGVCIPWTFQHGKHNAR